MFEAANTPQNLTDEASGYSFNDKKGGIYLYFTRGDAVIEDDGSETTAAAEDEEISASGSSAALSANPSDMDDGASEEESGNVATAISAGYAFILVGAGLVAGVVIGFAGGGVIRKRREKAVHRKTE